MFKPSSSHSTSKAPDLMSVAFREVRCTLPYLLPGLCWQGALVQEWGVLGHPPQGLVWVQVAFWLRRSSLRWWPRMQEILVASALFTGLCYF